MRWVGIAFFLSLAIVFAILIANKPREQCLKIGDALVLAGRCP